MIATSKLGVWIGMDVHGIFWTSFSHALNSVGKIVIDEWICVAPQSCSHSFLNRRPRRLSNQWVNNGQQGNSNNECNDRMIIVIIRWYTVMIWFCSKNSNDNNNDKYYESKCSAYQPSPSIFPHMMILRMESYESRTHTHVYIKYTHMYVCIYIYIYIFTRVYI